MGVTDQLKNILDKALEIHAEYAVMSTKFDNLESNVNRLLGDTGSRIETLETENRELRERLTRLEANFDAAVKGSIKEALVQVAREQLEKDGTLPTNVSLQQTKRIESGDS